MPPISRRPTASTKLTMKDLLRTASVDKRVATTLLKDPESFAKLYNLSKAQVAGLKEIGGKLGRGIIKDVASDVTYE